MNDSSKIHRLITLRGVREQSFKFAFGYKGGMKGCYTRGCEIITPLSTSVRGLNLTDVIVFDKMMNGEEKAKAWLW